MSGLLMKTSKSDNKKQKTGLSKEYFRDGKLSSVGKDMDSKKTRVWKYYDTNGTLIRTKNY